MTLKTLNFMIDDIQFRRPDIMGILEVVEPLADDLVHNGRVLCDVSSVLTKASGYQTFDSRQLSYSLAQYAGVLLY